MLADHAVTISYTSSGHPHGWARVCFRSQEDAHAALRYAGFVTGPRQHANDRGTGLWISLPDCLPDGDTHLEGLHVGRSQHVQPHQLLQLSTCQQDWQEHQDAKQQQQQLQLPQQVHDDENAHSEQLKAPAGAQLQLQPEEQEQLQERQQQQEQQQQPGDGIKPPDNGIQQQQQQRRRRWCRVSLSPSAGRLDTLFPYLPYHVRCRMRVDAVGAFSVTDQASALRMTEVRWRVHDMDSCLQCIGWGGIIRICIPRHLQTGTEGLACHG